MWRPLVITCCSVAVCVAWWTAPSWSYNAWPLGHWSSGCRSETSLSHLTGPQNHHTCESHHKKLIGILKVNKLNSLEINTSSVVLLNCRTVDYIIHVSIRLKEIFPTISKNPPRRFFFIKIPFYIYSFSIDWLTFLWPLSHFWGCLLRLVYWDFYIHWDSLNLECLRCSLIKSMETETKRTRLLIHLEEQCFSVMGWPNYGL